MSHDATSWARKQETGNTPAKFLLMMLADYAGSDYTCWPGQATLANLTEMSERTVRRATDLLVARGLIRVFYRYRDDGSRRSCRYQLLLDGPETDFPEPIDWRRWRQAEPDSTTTDHPDSVTAPPGQAVQTYRSESPAIPYKEPSPEPSPVISGASRTQRATRLPDDFQPDEKMRAWFAAEKLAAAIADPRSEHENFCDYWRAKAGQDARKLDWPATWRRWMRNAAARSWSRPTSALSPVSGAPQCRPSTTDQKVAQTLELGRRLQAMEENE